jgi:segregation and condensation protein B
MPEEAEMSDSQPQSEINAGTGTEARNLRLLEAILFSSPEPLAEAVIAEHLPDGADVNALLATLDDHYRARGITLEGAGGRWGFRTAEDLAEDLRVHKTVARKLSRAAMETLAIIAYHQPVTRGEIEEIRGVGLSRGTLDTLLESGWVCLKGRRRTPGRPVTWGTTDGFLYDFNLEAISALPGLDDLKAAGLLDKRPAIQITDRLQPHEDPEDIEDEAEDREDAFDELMAEPEESGNSADEGSESRVIPIEPGRGETDGEMEDGKDDTRD